MKQFFEGRKRIQGVPRPKNEAEIAQWKKVGQMPDQLPMEAIQKQIEREAQTKNHFYTTLDVPRDEFKEALWKAMKKYLKTHTLVPDGNFIEVVNDLVDYFLCLPDAKYSPDKGIFLYGGVGLGKTMLMRSFWDVLKRMESKMKFQFAAMKDIYFDVTSESNIASVRHYFKANYCFDDLGFENSAVKIYGNEMSIAEIILDKRYIEFQRGYQRTHVTSNLMPFHDPNIDIPSVLDCYGVRIASRCKEMFHFVQLHGKDKRG